MEPRGLLCYDDQGMNENYQTIMTGLVSRLYLRPIEREFLPWVKTAPTSKGAFYSHS